MFFSVRHEYSAEKIICIINLSDALTLGVAYDEGGASSPVGLQVSRDLLQQQRRRRLFVLKAKVAA